MAETTSQDRYWPYAMHELMNRPIDEVHCRLEEVPVPQTIALKRLCSHHLL